MRKIRVIYSDYLISQQVIRLIAEKARENSMDHSRPLQKRGRQLGEAFRNQSDAEARRWACTWQRNEAWKCVERWLQTSVNALPLKERSVLPPSSTSLLWRAVSENSPAFRKLDEELDRKSLGGLALSIITLVRGELAERWPPEVREDAALLCLSQDGRALTYLSWSSKLTARMSFLLKKGHSLLEVAASKMLCDAMFPAGSSWSLPGPYYEVLPLARPKSFERQQQAGRTYVEPEMRTCAWPEPPRGKFYPDGDPAFLYNVLAEEAPERPFSPSRPASSPPIEKWTEGFSNPFNSLLLEDGNRFCSLWPVVDSCFGAEVGFFDLPSLAGSNWCINPPFIEVILERAARKVLDFFSSPGEHAEKFLFLGPSWPDAAYYDVMKQIAEIVPCVKRQGTILSMGCRDAFQDKPIHSQCPIVEFRIGH